MTTPSADSDPVPPPPSTLVHPAPSLVPPPSLGYPVQERQAPHHLGPSDFGPYGHHKEAIANAYEDWLNGVPVANLITANLEYAAKFILDDAHLANPVISEEVNLPDAPTFCEVMASPKCDKWHQAILEELAAIREAGTWELIDCPPNICNIVSCHFVLQKKHHADGKVTKYKAWLIAQGFSQCEGIDYSETFTPVVKSASLRVFLAICTRHGWKVHQMDIKSAYLNGSINEDIYM